jgi:glucokinase
VTLETIIRPPATGLARQDHFIGVEVGPAIIRAGVFSESLRWIGKTKFSTKVERGALAVIERVAKCIHYAVDECDLSMNRIRAIGVGLPGRVDPETSRVESAPALMWGQVPLGRELEERLHLPTFAGNVHALGTLGIHVQEAKAAPRRFAALFLGAEIGGGVIVDDEICDLSALPIRAPLCEAPQLNVFRTLPGAEFRHWRSRDFRKALRKGQPAVAEFIREIAARTGQIAAGLVERFGPEVVAIGGGILDEMREEILRIAEASLRQALDAGQELDVTLLPSGLGDLAGVTGAAVWAARRSRQASGVMASR